MPGPRGPAPPSSTSHPAEYVDHERAFVREIDALATDSRSSVEEGEYARFRSRGHSDRWADPMDCQVDDYGSEEFFLLAPTDAHG